MIADKTERYQAMKFSEGHYLQVEVAGIIANSPEKALAQRFLAFMIGPGFQDTIPENNWMFPVSATTAPLPDAFGKLVVPDKTFLYSPEEVAAHRRQWIDEWLNAMSK
jgi:thiamine transport system substrate-binding protein